MPPDLGGVVSPVALPATTSCDMAQLSRFANGWTPTVALAPSYGTVPSDGTGEQISDDGGDGVCPDNESLLGDDFVGTDRDSVSAYDSDEPAESAEQPPTGVPTFVSGEQWSFRIVPVE